MGSTATRKIDGFVSLGGEVPYLDPNRVAIVGIDVPETPENWFAHCPRVNDETDADLEPYVQHVLSGGKTDPIDAYRDGDQMVTLDGRRTVRAVRIARSRQAQARVPVAERATVRVIVHKGSPEDLFRVNAESHNQRPLTPTQRAKLVLTYYNRASEDVKKTAEFFRLSASRVRQVLLLFDLDEAVQKAVDGGFPMAHALKLADLPREEQRKAVSELAAAGATRGAAAANGVAAAKRGEKVEAPDRRRMRSRTFLERWLAELKKEGYRDLAQTIEFVLGGPEMPAASADARLGETLSRAGLKRGTDEATDAAA